MKVAIQGSLGLGGIGTVTRELASQLCKYAQVTVFDVLSPYQNGFDGAAVKKAVVSSSRITRNLPVNLPFHALAFSKYDLVHVNYGVYAVSAMLSRAIFGIPFIETIHGLPQPEIEKGYDRLGYHAEQWALPFTLDQASSVVCDSKYLQNELVRRFGVYSSVIPLGVDIERFTPASEERVRLTRTALGIRKEETVILYVGRFHPWKDPLTLLRAASIALKERKDLVFIFVGKGPLESVLYKEASKLGIDDKIRIITNANSFESVGQYYDVADIFVCPTKKEVFGLVLLEAMSCGIPVINGDDGAAVEM